MDPDRPEDDLNQRVERLEKEVEELRSALLRKGGERTTSSSPSAPDAPQPGDSRTRYAPPRWTSPLKSTRSVRDLVDSIEEWLPKVGIGLVILAVGFLFKYSIDQGWIVPVVRIAFGYALGLVFLVLGFRLSESRPQYVQVLFGGAIATFYITAFAAFRLYGLLSYPFAFGLMVAATLLAFFLSLQQDRASLSVIGVAGGLGTPFLLFTGSGSVPGLVAYASLVIAGASAIYFHRGWRSLLWVTVVGGWSVMIAALNATSSGAPFTEKASVQLGVTYAWLSFWALPVLREVVATGDPRRWRVPEAPAGLDERTREWMRRHVHALSVSMPLLALLLTGLTWSLSRRELGFVALGLSATYALVAWLVIQRPSVAELGRTQGLVALMLSTVALALLLDGEVLLLTLAAQGLVVHAIAQRTSDPLTTAWGHFLFLIVAQWLVIRLFGGASGTAILNADASTDLAVVAAGVGASAVLHARGLARLRTAYLLAAHGALLLWLWRELVPLAGGHAYVSMAWAAYAVGLLVVGLRSAREGMWQTGAVTLLLLVGKLFVVDLANLDAIWRILLFMVVGGGFLVLGYAFPNLRRKTEGDDGS